MDPPGRSVWCRSMTTNTNGPGAGTPSATDMDIPIHNWRRSRESLDAQFSDAHPAVRNLMKHFANDHLPPELATVSAVVGRAAVLIGLSDLPDSAEKTVCLRKLLEAKDALVRAALD